MIRPFKCKETEKMFQRIFLQKIPRDVQKIVFRKLRMLNRSISLDDLRVPPGNRLQKLRAKRKGQYSIRINERYRICFEWRDNDAHNVEIVDYY